MKIRKNIIAVIMSGLMLVNIISLPVHAAVAVVETEPNNTRENAMLIQANRETASGTVTGSNPGHYAVEGSTSANDDDWYKVFLSEGIQYVSLNSGANTLVFDVYYDTGEVPILSDTYEKATFGVTAYQFEAQASGYYYVRIHTNMSSSQKYYLLVGDPNYSVAECSVRIGSVTMSGSNSTISFNLINEARLPQDAVVYSMKVNNVGTTDVKGISIRNNSIDITTNLNRYTWYKSGLTSLSLPLRSSWQVTFEYSKNITLTPTVKFQYVYPITSKAVDDSITITSR